MVAFFDFTNKTCCFFRLSWKCVENWSDPKKGRKKHISKNRCTRHNRQIVNWPLVYASVCVCVFDARAVWLHIKVAYAFGQKKWHASLGKAINQCTKMTMQCTKIIINIQLVLIVNGIYGCTMSHSFLYKSSHIIPRIRKCRAQFSMWHVTLCSFCLFLSLSLFCEY